MVLYIAVLVIGLIVSVVLSVWADSFVSSKKFTSLVKACGWTIGFASTYYAFFNIFSDDKIDGLFLALCSVIYFIVTGLAYYFALKWAEKEPKQELKRQIR